MKKKGDDWFFPQINLRLIIKGFELVSPVREVAHGPLVILNATHL